MNNPRTVALVYVRKSMVKAGAPAPASPEMQEAECVRVAQAYGLTPEVYRDAVGHSSGKTDDRPGWQACRARIGHPDVGALIVYNWGRAARNARILLELVDDLDRAGVRFVAVQNNIDTSSAQGRFQLTIMAGMDEYESNIASERRADSIDYLRRARGRHYGQAPFGSERKPHNGDLVLFPSTKPQPNGTDHGALVRLYELYATGSATMYSAVPVLNDEGWRYRARDGQLRPWGVDDVRRCLANYWIYAGYVGIGRGPKRELVKGSHAPILTDDLTALVGARMESHPSGQKKHKPFIYPLSGFLYCQCGQRLRGNEHRDERFYRHYSRCTAGQTYEIAASAVESLVRTHIATRPIPADVLGDVARIDADLLSAMLREQKTGPSAAMERKRLTQAIERLALLFSEGEIPIEQYRVQKAQFEAQMPPPEPEPTTGPNRQDLMRLALMRENVMDAGLGVFREMAEALYEKIEVVEGTKLKYTPQEWCKDWA